MQVPQRGQRRGDAEQGASCKEKPARGMGAGSFHGIIPLRFYVIDYNIMATRRKSYHHGDLQQALVEAAFTHVNREGPDSLSLAQLARQLGVSQPAPYRHFADRGALLNAVAVRGFREFIAQLDRAAAAGRKPGALSRMGRAYVEFGTTRPGIYRLMFASPLLCETAPDSELALVARESFMQLVNALDDSAGEQARMRRALHIWVGLHGVVMLTNQGLLAGTVSGVKLPELLDTILAT
jgi:AcrR family transcriptional regulator